MRHRLFIYFSILSPFLCATTLVSWVASTYREHALVWAGWKDRSSGVWQGWGMKAERGKLVAFRFSGTWKFDDPGKAGASDSRMQPHFVHESHPLVGFSYPPRNAFEWKTYHARGGGTYIEFHFVGLPLWFPTTLFATPIVLWRIPMLSRRRRARRQGFDMLPQPAK